MSRRVTVGLYGAVALLLALVVGMVFVIRARPPEVVERHAVTRAPVRVQAAAVRDLPDLLTLSGRVEPWRAATLAAARAGTLTALEATEGDVVAPGQVLARVDPRVWEAAAARARADLEDADRQRGRLEALHAEGAVSSNDLDTARSRAVIARAALSEAEAFLSQSVVAAPFAGIINRRLVELGDFVPEGGAVFELVDSERVKVVLDVAERDVSALTGGMPMAFSVAALGEASYTGRVAFVAAAAVTGGSAFRVELAVDNPDGRLRPGMLADVAVPRGLHRDRVVLPLAAVLPLKGEHVVFVVQDGFALRRLVTLAALVGQEVVLERGIAPGDQVVIEGQRSLADGVPVEVRDEASAGVEPQD